MSNDLLAGNVVSLIPEYKPPRKELWLICPSRQLLTPAAWLLRDMLKKKTAAILKKLIEKGFFDVSVLG